MPEDARCEMMKGNIALDGGKQTGMGHCISERHSAVDDFFLGAATVIPHSCGSFLFFEKKLFCDGGKKGRMGHYISKRCKKAPEK